MHIYFFVLVFHHVEQVIFVLQNAEPFGGRYQSIQLSPPLPPLFFNESLSIKFPQVLHRRGAWVILPFINTLGSWKCVLHVVYLCISHWWFFGTRRNEWYTCRNMAIVGLMGRNFTVFSPVLYRLSIILSCCLFLMMDLIRKPKNYTKLVWAHAVMWLPWPLKWCTSIGVTFLHLLQIVFPTSFNYMSTF